MAYTAATMPGYGDQATWPACTGHPNDPRTAPPDEGSSRQPLGEWHVLVAYEYAGPGTVTIVCVVLPGGFGVEADCFADWQLAEWATAIEGEYERAADEAQAYACGEE